MPITIIKVGKWKIMSLWTDIKCKVTKKVCNKFFSVMDCEVCWQHCCTSHQGFQCWHGILRRLLWFYLHLKGNIVGRWGLILWRWGISIAVNSCQKRIRPSSGPGSWSWQAWYWVQPRPGNGVQSCPRARHRVSPPLLGATQTTQSLLQHLIGAKTWKNFIKDPPSTYLPDIMLQSISDPCQYNDENASCWPDDK